MRDFLRTHAFVKPEIECHRMTFTTCEDRIDSDQVNKMQQCSLRYLIPNTRLEIPSTLWTKGVQCVCIYNTQYTRVVHLHVQEQFEKETSYTA